MEKKLENKLIKYRSQLSGKDLKSLLSDARERQQEILRQRNLNRIRQNEMMRQRLIEKRNAQVCLRSTFSDAVKYYLKHVDVIT